LLGGRELGRELRVEVAGKVLSIVRRVDDRRRRVALAEAGQRVAGTRDERRAVDEPDDVRPVCSGLRDDKAAIRVADEDLFPAMLSRAARTVATSSAAFSKLSRGATTVYPSLVNPALTSSQPSGPAKPPWTRTIVRSDPLAVAVTRSFVGVDSLVR
jgi:hypothetical protein